MTPSETLYTAIDEPHLQSNERNTFKKLAMSDNCIRCICSKLNVQTLFYIHIKCITLTPLGPLLVGMVGQLRMDIAVYKVNW